MNCNKCCCITLNNLFQTHSTVFIACIDKRALCIWHNIYSPLCKPFNSQDHRVHSRSDNISNMTDFRRSERPPFPPSHEKGNVELHHAVTNHTQMLKSWNTYGCVSYEMILSYPMVHPSKLWNDSFIPHGAPKVSYEMILSYPMVHPSKLWNDSFIPHVAWVMKWFFHTPWCTQVVKLKKGFQWIAFSCNNIGLILGRKIKSDITPWATASRPSLQTM